MFKYLLILFLGLNLFGCNSASKLPNDVIPKHDSIKLFSKILNETRTINIWLPDEYYSDNKKSFPVMYMPDGGIAEDFPHIANTLSSLIHSKKIAPTILVGIENTQRRRDLTGPTNVEEDKKIAPVVGGSEQFRNFIKNELFAEINKLYRTTNYKGIIGESLAGLFTTEIFLTDPEMFDYYIAMDPSLWWNDNFLLKNAQNYLSKFPTDNKKYWFAGSGVKGMRDDTHRLEKILQATSIPNLKWHYSDEPKEKHSTIYRATKEKAIIWTLGN